MFFAYMKNADLAFRTIQSLQFVPWGNLGNTGGARLKDSILVSLILLDRFPVDLGTDMTIHDFTLIKQREYSRDQWVRISVVVFATVEGSFSQNLGTE